MHTGQRTLKVLGRTVKIFEEIMEYRFDINNFFSFFFYALIPKPNPLVFQTKLSI